MKETPLGRFYGFDLVLKTSEDIKDSDMQKKFENYIKDLAKIARDSGKLTII